MNIEDVIAKRGISEILHFTTNAGLLGVFAVASILPRADLPEEKYLEYVYRPNAAYRKDAAWTGHVSLSISRVNTNFFGASRNWHSATDLWWCVVSIDPIILTHDNVVFATTNNIYPACRRATGPAGLEALFAPEVAGRYSETTRRTPGMPDNWTTDVQAEVLYPRPLPTEFVRRVYVLHDGHADIVAAQYEILNQHEETADPRPELPIEVRPDVFD